MDQIGKLTDRLRKQAKCIYIAVEETVANDISDGLTQAADTIDRLTAALRAIEQRCNETTPSSGDRETVHAVHEIAIHSLSPVTEEKASGANGELTKGTLP